MEGTNNESMIEALAAMDPNSSILRTVQERITEQLSRQNEELLLNIKETEDKIKKSSTFRENVGVELYTVQQQLAKLQENLERYHDHFHMIQGLREEAEKKKNQYSESANQRKATLEMQRKRFYEYQVELDKISAKLIRVEKYHEQIVSDIAVKRRKTYKTEEEMEKIEKDKKDQDILIDRMNAQVKDLQKQIGIYETQIKEQLGEKDIAKQLLSEATSEMEATRFEKKGLIQQWKSSHVGMQRRDQALQATEQGLRLQKEQIKEIHNEIEGYRATINIEKDKNERLTSVLIKHENEKKYMDTRLDHITKTLLEKHNQYQSFKTTLDQTEEQTRKEEQQSKLINIEIASVEAKIAKTSNEIRELENGLLQLFSEQTTFQKDYQSTLNSIQKKKDLIRDKELSASQLENELARIRVDELQTNDHNKALNSIVDELEKDIQQKDILIEKYESEIRRRHDEIERKQNHLDKLNRLYEKLTSNQQEENFGPLEAMIHNINKAINEKLKSNEQLKRDWTNSQTELVSLVFESEQLSLLLQNIQSKQSVLTQKRKRLESGSEQEQQEYKVLCIEMNQMHHDLVKLNQLISKNAQLQQILADSNYGKQNEILDRLKKRETECLEMEANIERIKEEKKDLLDELIDVERQIMAWNKKIEIQKEIQDALDPEVGQEEISRMKKEIHIMKQRLEELQRQSKQKIAEMEKCVAKKDVILIKGKSQVTVNKKQTNTKANIYRQEVQLNQEVEKRKQASQKTFNQIRKYQQEAEEAAIQIQQAEQQVSLEKNEMKRLRDQIEMLNVEKSRISAEKERVKEMVRRYQLVLKGSQYKYDVKTEEQEKQVGELLKQKNKIISVIQSLQSEYQFAAEHLAIAQAIIKGS